MAAQWASQQREGWLSFYGTQTSRSVDASGQEIEKKSLAPTDFQWRLVRVLEDLLESDIEPRMAAERLAPLILSQTDTSGSWNNFYGCLFAAIEEFSDETVLTKLADLLVSLATLDAGNEAQITSQSGGNGHWRDDRDLAGLPYFGWNLRDRMNGPEAYLNDDGESAEIAKNRWRNVNTFTAISTHAYAATVPALSHNIIFALWTLANALEHDPGTRVGKNLKLHLPAATQWILIAAAEILNATAQHQKTPTGPRWEAEGGTSQFTVDRWLFWQHRFAALAESDVLDTDTKDAARKAADKMAAVPSE